MRRLAFLFSLAAALCVSPLLSAQVSESKNPRAEVFGGYSGYRAGGKVNDVTVPDFTTGWAGQVMIPTTRWVAIVADFNGHYNSFASANDFAVGVRAQLPLWRFVPFGEGLLGVQHFSPRGLPSQNTPTYIGGAGLDVKITPRFSVRPFQLSYINTFYSANLASVNDQKNPFNGFRVQAGLIYNFLPSPEINALAMCDVEPATVYAGDPVKLTVATRGFRPKRKLSYSYESTGGKVAGNLDAASVDTTGVDAGTYTVSGKVVDDGKGRHQHTAGCQATFDVKAKQPPTISVSADPASVLPGDPSKIAVSGKSGDNRPLTYDCSSSAGQLSGSDRSYTLDTKGAPEGNVTVKCTVRDDRGLSATASASVEVTVPRSKALEPAKYGTIAFLHDTKRPTRVDNEAKGELDRFADALAATPDAKAIVLGYSSAAESKDNKSLDFAAQRAVNTKDYLKKDKGIDPLRVELRIGSGDGQKVELWLVPAGAIFSSEGNTAVDERKVTAVPRAALRKSHKQAKKHKHGAK